jgi:hypothetical protein
MFVIFRTKFEGGFFLVMYMQLVLVADKRWETASGSKASGPAKAEGLSVVRLSQGLVAKGLHVEEGAGPRGTYDERRETIQRNIGQKIAADHVLLYLGR